MDCFNGWYLENGGVMCVKLETLLKKDIDFFGMDYLGDGFGVDMNLKRYRNDHGESGFLSGGYQDGVYSLVDACGEFDDVDLNLHSKDWKDLLRQLREKFGPVEKMDFY
jgi:hypothetical protein